MSEELKNTAEHDERPIKVEVSHLTKYFNTLHVLDDISFQVKKGEFVCVVGPTGCGKTTFLNLLTKVMEPSEGILKIDGEAADPRKHSIARVFQEPSLFHWLTVRQNLEFGLKVKKLPQTTVNGRVEKIVRLLGLEEVENSYMSSLSVSTQQRVVIGRAFAMEPDLLLMDEPYGQMDIKLRFYLEDEVLRLWREMGTTVVFVTHNIEEAVYLSEKILILTNKPAAIKEDLVNSLPYPREIISPEFIEMRRHVTEQIKWW